jgi:hypothetical protein
MPLLSRAELTPSRNTFFRCRAYATATPRAPDGLVFKARTHTAGYRSIDASHCRLSPTGNSCARRRSACPCRHPRRASRRSTCVPHGGFPWLRCTYADLGVRTFATGCFGTGCMPDNGSAKPFAARIIARVSKKMLGNPLCGRGKEKPPDGHPRAFAFLGDRVDRSPRKEDQAWWRSKPGCGRFAQSSASRHEREGSELRLRRRAAFIGKTRWNLVEVVQESKRSLRCGRTLHPAFQDCKHFFHIRARSDR